ncbi:hypothetical protein [Aequorivita echinoideorum]|uniref:Uncharacterized protein n=1 Tax=Aequorivita echinoideorum TaxID=1549647 RepID=A0ABS5S348_9FLAO|nr:hypothetical protein [Aequorivita echinoideorum]MBT0607643.1 hypothetical protein [Aequorivita echinoideorum]
MKKYIIYIADAYFIEKYGIEWAGFTSAQRKEKRKEAADEIDKAIQEGKEINDTKGYIEIEEVAINQQPSTNN